MPSDEGQQLKEFVEQVGDQYFIDCVKGARSRTEVIRMLGFIPSNSTNHACEILMQKLNLTKEHFSNAWNEKKAEDVFINHADGKRHTPSKVLKRLLIRTGREYRCEGLKELGTACTNNGIWNGKPMTLEIDHVNGDRSDDREENLRFICPNCHSQTRDFRVVFAKRYERNGRDRWETRRQRRGGRAA